VKILRRKGSEVTWTYKENAKEREKKRERRLREERKRDDTKMREEGTLSEVEREG